MDEDMKKGFPMMRSKAEDATGLSRRSALSRWMRSTAPGLAFLLPLAAASQAVAQEDESNSPYEAPKYMTASPLGVDLGSGKFSYSATDLSIGPLTLQRSYLGGQTLYGKMQFGPNWGHNHSSYFFMKPPNRHLQRESPALVIDGKTLIFHDGGSAGIRPASPQAAGTFLENRNGAMVFTDQQGNVHTFNPSVTIFGVPSSQRIARIEYANGHTIVYKYSGTGVEARLEEIASNLGYSIIFENNGPNRYVSKACGYNRAEALVTPGSCNGAKMIVGYAYAALDPSLPATAPRPLVNVTDALGQTHGYAYFDTRSPGRLTCIKKTNSSVCQLKNEHYIGGGGTKEYWVLKQTTADGGIWNYNIQGPDREYDPAAHNGYLETTGGGYTDPNGNEVWMEYYGGQPVRYHNYGNRSNPDFSARVTELGWDGLELASLTHPEGNKVHYWRWGELVLQETWTPKSNSGIEPVITRSEFPFRSADCATVGRKRCHKPIWTEDFKGNRTHYTYWPEHGGINTETGPALDGVSPLKRVSPQKRYTYVARTAPAGGAIWLLSTMSFCRTTNFENGACREDGVVKAGDEVVTTYDYEPKNLNLRAETVTADGTSRRTCHSYDWKGQKISTTGPSGTCS